MPLTTSIKACVGVSLGWCVRIAQKGVAGRHQNALLLLLHAFNHDPPPWLRTLRRKAGERKGRAARCIPENAGFQNVTPILLALSGIIKRLTAWGMGGENGVAQITSSAEH